MRPGVVRRRAGAVLAAVLVSAVCVAAGAWQWHRHAERSAAIAVVVAGYDAAPRPLDELLAPDADLPPDAVWRPATVTGRYLDDGAVLLRNRPVAGQAGFHVLAPFAISEGALAGRVLVVDRGWVPAGQDASAPDAVPAPPSGQVDVVVRLRADERPATRTAPPGQVHAIAADQVREASAAGWDAGASLPLYGGLVSEDGGAAVGLGPLDRPRTDPGSHLSYAFQWWVFALGALVTCAVLVVREERALAEEDRAGAEPSAAGPPGEGGTGADVAPGARVPARPAPRPARRRRPTAEEEEDALLDGRPLR